MENPNRLCRFSVFSFLAILAFSFTASAGAAESKSSFPAGQKAPAFQARTTDGKQINFPDTYKGKVVLLVFWATWCPPCRAEIPNVVAAYQRFHAQGFEVLGISLDKPNSAAVLAKFTKDNQMSWPQIYDGKYWKADLAQKYGVRSIPRALLVDGDTGIVLAEGADARARHLAPAIEKALASKKEHNRK